MDRRDQDLFVHEWVRPEIRDPHPRLVALVRRWDPIQRGLLVRVGDRYELDLEDAQARLTGKEKMIIWCSPQNPSGRVWTAEELRAVADFAERNDLVLVVDEIHHDIVYPGNRFVPFDVAAPEVRPRTAFLTAASKTFNIAGQRTGHVVK